MRRRPAHLVPPDPHPSRDPDQDPALWPQAVAGMLQALGPLRLRPLRPDDSRAVTARLFPGVDAYFFKLVRGTNERPELFPPDLARRLQRKAARLAGWQTLRGVLETTLSRVAATQLREQAEMLSLSQQVEDFVRTAPDGAAPEVLQRRFLLIRSALQVRAEHSRTQAKLRRNAWKAQREPGAPAPQPRRSVGLRAPARSLQDLETRDLLEELLGRKRP